MILGRMIIPNAIQVNLKNSLASCWEFNETSGNTAAAAHGSITVGFSGNQIWTSGKLNNCVQLTHTSGEQLITSGVPFNSFPFSISVWFNHTDLNWNGLWITTSQSNHDGFEIHRSAYSGDIHIYYRNDEGSNIAYYVYGSSVTAETWYHLVITASGMGYGQTKAYLNGVELTPNSYSPSDAILQFTDGDNWRLNYAGTGNIKIDQTAFWTKVLSSDEVSWLYNSGNGRAYSSW